MAAMGQVCDAYWDGCHPAREKYVQRFRILVRSIPADKQGARAARLGIPPSTLSNYWSGRRVPKLGKLRSMYETAFSQSDRLRDGHVSLSELEGLQPAASKRLAPEVVRDRNAASRLALSAAPPEVNGSPSGHRRESGAVPAGRPATDRHNRMSHITRQTVDALTGAHAAGDRRTLLAIAWSASNTLSNVELSMAVMELHAVGRSDLAEAILLGGQGRTQDDTMRLALALMETGRTEYAEVVMRTALPPEPH